MKMEISMASDLPLGGPHLQVSLLGKALMMMTCITLAHKRDLIWAIS